MSPPARPDSKLPHALQVRLPAEVLDLVRTEASRQDRTVSTWLRALIAEKLRPPPPELATDPGARAEIKQMQSLLLRQSKQIELLQSTLEFIALDIGVTLPK